VTGDPPEAGLEDVPEPEGTPGIAARLPRKRTAAGALVRDPRGRLVFVVPAYKPGLDIPGGMVEDGESPARACRREVAEEIGLDLTPGRLLVVDWTPARGVWSDALALVFDGGVLSEQQARDLRAHDAELLDALLLTLDEAAARLRPGMLRRLRAASAALDDGRFRYLENGTDPAAGGT
jgi:8-oxo-dGTP pyrophosphatase MutT (NUDIX family)